MKLQTFAAALAATAISGSAFAADLPSRKIAPAYVAPAPLLMWNGFYLGLNAGYAWSDRTATTSALPFFANPGLGGSTPSSQLAALSASGSIGSKSGGFLIGAQAGYNMQLSPSFVAGIETDIQGVFGSSGVSSFGAAGDGTRTYFAAGDTRARLDWFGTLRARVGFLAAPSLLFYATGGLAYGGAKLSDNVVQTRAPVAATTVPFGGATAYSGMRVGYTVGGGAEYKFSQAWSAKLEYLYYDLGSAKANGAWIQVNAAGVPFIGVAAETTRRFSGHIVRAGLNYHFGGAAAPVVAKY